MQLKNRINLMARLGEYLMENNEEFKEIKSKATRQNPWFTPEFVDLSIKNIATNFLPQSKLEKWTENYAINDQPNNRKIVGLVMPGNIPLVGFHDLLCVFMAGHSAKIKASSKDEVLIKHLVEKLQEWTDGEKNEIAFAENLKGCNAYIATGSNNTSRYFEHYFGKYPSIIRRSRTSVAIIDGSETNTEFSLLSDDMQLYFGLGCRNVTKLFLPENYDFLPLFEAAKKYAYFLDFHKYKHNYDYQLALLIMNGKYYMSSGPLIFTESKTVFSPVSQVYYEYYSSLTDALNDLETNPDIQCIVGHGQVEFGQSQSPSLMDYADAVDTMKFLKALN